MAINHYWGVDPLLLGGIALQTGQNQFAQNERQRNQGLALQQQELAMRQQDANARQSLAQESMRRETLNDNWRRRYAQEQLDQQGYQFDASMVQRDQAAQDQLAAMQFQAGNQLGLERMREGFQTQQQKNVFANQFEMQRRQESIRQAQADWTRLEEYKRRATPQDYENALHGYMDKWQNTGAPMPFEIPNDPIPDWMDPQKKWESAHQADPTMPWQMDENGNVQAPRGYGESQQQIQHKTAAEIEKIKEQGAYHTHIAEINATEKQAAAAAREKAAIEKQKVADANAEIDIQHEVLDAYKPKHGDEHYKRPNEAEKMVWTDQSEQEFQKDLDAWAAKKRAIPKRKQIQQEQQQQQEIPVDVHSREEIDALPDNALYRAPDGSLWRK